MINEQGWKPMAAPLLSPLGAVFLTLIWHTGYVKLLWALAWIGLILHGGQANLGLSPLCSRMDATSLGFTDLSVRKHMVLAGGTPLTY